MNGEKIVLVFILLFGLAVITALVSALFMPEHEIVTTQFIKVSGLSISVTLFTVALIMSILLGYFVGLTWKKIIVNFIYTFTMALLFASFTTIIQQTLHVSATQITSVDLALSVIVGFIVGSVIVSVFKLIKGKKGEIVLTGGAVIVLAVLFFILLIFLWVSGVFRVLLIALLSLLVLYIGYKYGIPEKMLYTVLAIIFVVMIFSAIKTQYFSVLP